MDFAINIVVRRHDFAARKEADNLAPKMIGLSILDSWVPSRHACDRRALRNRSNSLDWHSVAMLRPLAGAGCDVRPCI